MADIRALIPEQEKIYSSSDPGLWRGLIVKPAPTLVTDFCFVSLVDIKDDNVFGPCYWMPRIQELPTDVSEPGPPPESDHIIPIGRYLFPVVGDLVLLAQDNERFPWIVGWWPA